jgi:hypothetical protein
MSNFVADVPIDEAEALRIAAHCKPEDIENGNLEQMIYLALRLAYWRGYKERAE